MNEEDKKSLEIEARELCEAYVSHPDALPASIKIARDWLAAHPEPVRGNSGKVLIVDDSWEHS
jgi:hypothetical protein